MNEQRVHPNESHFHLPHLHSPHLPHPSASHGSKSTKLSDVFMMEDSSMIPKTFLTPSEYTRIRRGKKEKYQLSFIENVFITLEDPNTSILAFVIMIVMNLFIILGCISYVLSNDKDYLVHHEHCPDPVCHDDPTLCPGYTVCPPEPLPELEEIETIILYVFTIEYLLRVICVLFVRPRLSGVYHHAEQYITGKSHEDDEDEKYEFEIGEEEAAAAEMREVTRAQSSDPSSLDTPILHTDVEVNPFLRAFLYMTEWKNVIDICTILPFYIFEHALGKKQGFNFIRVLRLSRILHIFKLTKDNQILHLLERTMYISAPAMALVFFISGVGMILCGSIVYFCESGKFMVTLDHPHGSFMRKDILGEHWEETPFISLTSAMYWVITTATNTGYGDIVPTSQGGRAVACIVMMIGVIVAAVPVGVIGSNFSHEYDRMHERYVIVKRKRKERELRKLGLLPPLQPPVPPPSLAAGSNKEKEKEKDPLAEPHQREGEGEESASQAMVRKLKEAELRFQVLVDRQKEQEEGMRMIRVSMEKEREEISGLLNASLDLISHHK